PGGQEWILPYTLRSLQMLLQYLDGYAVQFDDALIMESEVIRNWIDIKMEAPVPLKMCGYRFDSEQQMRLTLRLKQRGYSYRTIRAYVGHVERFFRYADERGKPAEAAIIHTYFLHLLHEGKSHAYVNQGISAVKFYMRHVLGKSDAEVSYVRPKREKKLPNI